MVTPQDPIPAPPVHATPIPPVIALDDAKAAKATLERIIAHAVIDYEERFGCRVTGVSLNFDRSFSSDPWRTIGATVSVQL
jgi:hypothetical protein